MLKLLLLRFWPVLLPLGFYAFWVWFMSRRAGDGRQIAEHIRKGLLFWAIITSVVLLIGSFIWWGVAQQENNTGAYVPAHVENGALVPGHVDPVTAPPPQP